MTKMNYVSFLLMLSFFFIGCSKTKKDPHLVINEVMVVNETNFMDNYGERSGWIEIYNNTAATKNLAGMFLTTDKNNPKMYAIPQGDVLTQVKPHQHVLFWADSEPFRGTFHTNFTLNADGENYIALYDVDGKTLLDEIVIPSGTLTTDKTYGYTVDGHKYNEDGSLRATVLDRVTPSSNNEIIGENPKIVDLKENDPEGLSLTFTSMLVVFSGLILLYLVFRGIGKAAKTISRKRADRAALGGAKTLEEADTEISGNVIAAISAAIYELSENQHDIESTILTIEQVKRNYSPWNAKRQSLRQHPHKK